MSLVKVHLTGSAVLALLAIGAILRLGVHLGSFYQRFTYLLQNHEAKQAELESFIEKTLSLYLSQLTGANGEVVKELFKALSTVQDERSYFDYALKTLATLRETLYVDAADTLVLHLMQQRYLTDIAAN